MEENTPLEDIGDKIKEYANTRYELIRLKAAEKVANIGSSIGMALVIALFLVFFLMFISVAGGIYLSILLESYIYGFLALGGIYLVLLLIFYIGRRSLIVNPLRNILIREMFEEKEERTHLK